MSKAASRQVSWCLVPRWWGTSERQSRRLEGKMGSLLKGEKSVSTPKILAWDCQTRSGHLLCMCSVRLRARGKSEKEIHSSCPSPSFPWKMSVIVHKLHTSLLDGRQTEELVHWCGLPSEWFGSSSAGVISSRPPGSLGWGPFWRWWESWRVWPRRRVVVECLRRQSRRSDCPGALKRLRHRCRGDCWLCCPPGCRLGWSDRWLWTPLASDLTGRRKRV